ncbi:MAG: DegT/DnrJ/EryC1/StrS family aminotransferase [Bacteroidetes bacterium]|nr:DegT/DnrJ/EryC1/StrS family aminotransferase [Bacteroidota bacterium]
MSEKRIQIARPSFLGNEKKYVLDALESGWISSIGPYIERFEMEFARYHGMKHAVATHNGTIALHLALAASGITNGDEVIVPDLTFIATSNSVRYCNATPLLTDVETNDWNISPGCIRNAIGEATKAIMPVHLYGNPARMVEIMNIAAEHNLVVIEDCAEATGALLQGRKVGTYGNISCFSFFGNKIMTTGEGGMCLTNDDELAEKMRILRDHGMNRNKKYWYDNLGFNYRMTNMQAAVGLAQLEQLDSLLASRDAILMRYKEQLSSCKGICFQETHGNRNVNWLVTVRLQGMDFETRDVVISELSLKHIDSRPVFYPIHFMSFYKDPVFMRGENPNSVLIAGEGLSLPTYVGLEEEKIDYIAACLIRAYKKYSA